MTDKEYKEEIARIKKLIDKWVDPLGLRWYKMHYKFHRTEDDGESAYTPSTEKMVAIMSVNVDYYYRTALINFFLPVCQGASDDDLERFFVHELMHIFLKPMQHKTKAAEEELVATSLADAVIWARQEGEHDYRRRHRRYADQAAKRADKPRTSRPR